MKNNKEKTFADISKDIKKKYDDRYDPISLNGLKTEMKRLRDMQEQLKEKEQLQQDQEMYAWGGLFDTITTAPDSGKSSPAWVDFSINQADPVDMSDFDKQLDQNQLFIDKQRNQNVSNFLQNDPVITNNKQSTETFRKEDTSSITRDPLMYALTLGPLAALLMNKRTDPIDRSEAGRFVSTGKGEAGVGTSNPRQTQFDEVSMSPIERALTERSRGFSGANVQASGGNAGQFLANELANQVNVLNSQGQASLGQQQMNTQIAGMNAQEQARIDQIKMQDKARQQQAENINAQLALQYDQIDDMNEGAFLTKRSNAVQAIFQNLGNIGKENTRDNIILKALGYDEMGNYGGKGKNSSRFLDSILDKLLK